MNWMPGTYTHLQKNFSYLIAQYVVCPIDTNISDSMPVIFYMTEVPSDAFWQWQRINK